MVGNNYSFSKLLMLFTILPIAAADAWQSDSTCGLGQFYSHYDDRVCLPCPEGTFMPDENHRITSCSPCTKAESEHVIKNCTSTNDTVLGCAEGSYWRRTGDATSSRGSCYPCTVCAHEETDKFEAKTCTEREDTVCCPEFGMVVAEKLTIFSQTKCVHQGEEFKETDSIEEPDGSILRFGGCKQNEFMIGYNSGNAAVFCKPCGRGSYVDKDDHMVAYCKPCTVEDVDIHVGCQDQINAIEKSNFEKTEEDPVNYATKMTPKRKKPHDPKVNSSAGLDNWYIILIIVVIFLVILSFIIINAQRRRWFFERLSAMVRRPYRPVRARVIVDP